VDTARTERTARVRRILSRAAVVLGGVAAGWLVSTASASAGTTEPEVVQSAMDVLVFPSQVDTAVDAMLPEPPAAPAGLEEFGRQVHGAVEQVGAKVADHLHLPAVQQDRDLGDGAASPKLRLLSLGDHDVAPIVQPLAAVQSSTGLVAAPEATHDYGRQPATEPDRRGPPADQSPQLPALPTLPVPLSPPGAPSGSCTSSCGNGSNDDLGIPVAHVWPSAHAGSATSRSLRLI
jgi:hypothetical protein